MGRQACMEGTREQLLDDIVAWAADSQTQPVFLLDGMAGTGKTTVTESLCRLLDSKGILAGSFFCWRFDNSERKDVRRILPSLAFSAARIFPTFSEALVAVLDDDPDIAYRSLEDQFEKLLSDPIDCAFQRDKPMPVFCR